MVSVTVLTNGLYNLSPLFFFFALLLLVFGVFFLPSHQPPALCSGILCSQIVSSRERWNLFLAANLCRHQGKRVSKGKSSELNQLWLGMQDLEIQGQFERKLETLQPFCKIWPFSLCMLNFGSLWILLVFPCILLCVDSCVVKQLNLLCRRVND